jgi:Na+-driven multidrug efflux pump
MAYFNSKFTMLRFRPKYMKLEPRLTGTILAMGFSSFAMQLAMILAGGIQNHTPDAYGGFGDGNCLQRHHGVFYAFTRHNPGDAAHDWFQLRRETIRRIVKAFKWALLAGTLFISAGFALIQIFPNLLIAFSSKEGGEFRNMDMYYLRVSTMFFPLIALQVFALQYFQAADKPVQSTILSLSRQILFYIPFLIVLPKAFGLDGGSAGVPGTFFG